MTRWRLKGPVLLSVLARKLRHLVPGHPLNMLCDHLWVLLRPAWELHPPQAVKNKQEGVIFNRANLWEACRTMFPSWRCKASNGTEEKPWEWPCVTPQGSWMGLIKQPPRPSQIMWRQQAEAFSQQRWGLLITVIYNSALITRVLL